MKADRFVIMLWTVLSILMSQSLTPKAQSPERLRPPEINSRSLPDLNIQRPNGFFSQRWGTDFTLLDSSKNGYGLAAHNTKPLSVSEEGWGLAYRKWAGAEAGSGQLAAAYAENGDNWLIYSNINHETGGALDPSFLAIEEYPYIFWTEIDSQGPDVGFRPMYSYDEFGWDGGSFSDPYDVDWLWTPTMLGAISPEVSENEFDDEVYFNIAALDWDNSRVILYHQEAYDDGFIIFCESQVVMDFSSDFPENLNYTSDPVLVTNGDGIGYCAVTSYYSDDSELNSIHTLVFVKTENYGASWHGPTDSTYYHIPLSVTDHMLASGQFPSEYHDPCDGDDPSNDLNFEHLFMTYHFDMKLDEYGNPHFVIGAMGELNAMVYPGIPNSRLFYLTIDQQHLDQPGDPQTETGWQYEWITEMDEYWRWDNEDSDPYWQIVFPKLIFDTEIDDFYYVVMSAPSCGEDVIVDDGGTSYDYCDDIVAYPQWNEDVFVFRT